MPAQRFHADYEELAQIAQRFGREAEAAQRMVESLRSAMGALEAGDWQGQGARAFYAEMNGSVLPSLSRMTKALANAQRVTGQVSREVKAGEDAAAAVLRATGAAADGKVPNIGISKDQISPETSNTGAMLGAAAGAALGSVVGPLGTLLGGAAGAALGAQFDAPGGRYVSQLDAPAQIDLPKSLNDGMNQAWKDSFPNGKSMEQGGLLVQKADGTLEFRRGSESTSGSFTPNYDDLKDGETLISVNHTHPYSIDPDGIDATDVSFSGGDLGNLVSRRDPMKMVQSGDGQFVVLRTQEFDARVNQLDKTGKQALYDEMRADFDKVMYADTDKFSFAERNDRAAEAVARKYGLAYYKGKGGAVNRVVP